MESKDHHHSGAAAHRAAAENPRAARADRHRRRS